MRSFNSTSLRIGVVIALLLFQTQPALTQAMFERGVGQGPVAFKQMKQAGEITLIHDVEYGRVGDRVLHVEIAMPTRRPNRPMPAVLYFHPGSFVEGSHKKNWIVFLAKLGYFTASVEYRFSTEAKFPAQLEDAQLAVRWLRAHSNEYGIDPNHIAVWGTSAGGMIAQWLGTMRHSDGFPKSGGYDDVDDSVQAVCSFFGVSDATLDFRVGKSSAVRGIAKKLFGVAYEENPEVYKTNSPITYVRSDDPPFFIVQGALDKVVLPQQGEEMSRALTRARVPHELIIVKNSGHMWKVKPNGPPPEPSLSEVQSRAVAFLDHYLCHTSPPRAQSDMRWRSPHLNRQADLPSQPFRQQSH
jgi:acetyl esterase/lipase